ncbi:MAG: hypothetical protein RR739_09465, partial [Clostridia bacterium]
KDTETKTVELGTITNYADFKKTGVAVSATATQGAVSISDAGVVTLTLDKPAVTTGAVKVSATLTATGCTAVKTKEFDLTVIKNPVPAKKEITVDAKSGAYKGSKGAYNVSLADKTIALKVNGYEVSNWATSSKKYMTIDANGAATLKKAGTVTVTATLKDGTKIKQKIVIAKKIADAVKIQIKTKKWNDAQQVPSFKLVLGKSYSKRAVAVGGGKLFDAKWSIADPTIVSIGTGKAQKLIANKLGSTTLTVTLFNGVTQTVNIEVVASAKEAGEDESVVETTVPDTDVIEDIVIE